MSAVTVSAGFKKLVITLGHMFYSGQCPPAWWVDAADPKKPETTENELTMFEEKKASQLAREAKRKAQQDTTGLGIVLLTTLVEKQWVEEDDLARSLNLPPKMVRRAMRFFEQEQLVQREHKKESKRARRKEKELMVQAGLREAKPGAAAGATGNSQGAAAAAAGAAPEEEEEDFVKGHVISYCALDYPRIVDSVRWRVHMMRKNLQKEIRGGNTLQQYKCPNPACGKEYNSMDVFDLMPSRARAGWFGMAGGDGDSKQLRCGICDTEIDMVLDEAGKTLGTMEDRKERLKKVRAMLDSFDTELKPLLDLLAAVEDLQPPDFNTYSAWLHNELAVKQRLDAIQSGAAAAATGKPGVQAQPTVSANTQVVLQFRDSSESQAAGASGAMPGIGGHAAAAGASGIPGLAPAAAGSSGVGGGGAAGGAAKKPLPPWLASQLNAQQHPQQQPASKPLPPWLVSSYNQQQTAGEQQQAAEAGSLAAAAAAGDGVKPDMFDLGLKPDPGFKHELKPDAGLKQELETAASMDEDWEAVPGTAGAAADGTGAAAGGSQPADAAVGDEEEDWEDV